MFGQKVQQQPGINNVFLFLQMDTNCRVTADRKFIPTGLCWSTPRWRPRTKGTTPARPATGGKTRTRETSTSRLWVSTRDQNNKLSFLHISFLTLGNFWPSSLPFYYFLWRVLKPDWILKWRWTVYACACLNSRKSGKKRSGGREWGKERENLGEYILASQRPSLNHLLMTPPTALFRRRKRSSSRSPKPLPPAPHSVSIPFAA